MRLLRTILMAAVLSGMLLVAASCGSRQRTAEQTLRELSAAGELVTCEYTVSKVIKADDMVPWKIGDRKILFSCNAYLKAGVDMAAYNPAKTVIDQEKKSVILVLPSPKVLSVNIPVEEIRLVYSRVTGLRDEFNKAIGDMKEDGTMEVLVQQQITDVISGGEILREPLRGCSE